MNPKLYRLKNLPHRLRGTLANGLDMMAGRAKPEAALRIRVIRSNGRIEDLGVVSKRVVTDAFVNYVVNAMQDSATYPMDVFKYHGSGTGTTAEAAGDTGLVTEVGSRVAGTQAAGASSNIYKTVATISYTASYAITEHGVFSAATGGTLVDRSVFSAVNVANGDSIQFTYELTFSSGG